jgi:hypothetical protein
MSTTRTLAIGEAAVLDGHPVAKDGMERPRDRRREGDLRHQDQNSPSRRRDVLREAEIQLGLSAARHAVQQRRGKCAGRRQCPQPIECVRLFRRQDDTAIGTRGVPDRMTERVPLDAPPADRHQPQCRESLHGRGRQPPLVQFTRVEPVRCPSQ